MKITNGPVITVITVIMVIMVIIITTTHYDHSKPYRHVHTALRSTLLTLVCCSIRVGVVTSKLSRLVHVHFDYLCSVFAKSDPQKRWYSR